MKQWKETPIVLSKTLLYGILLVSLFLLYFLIMKKGVQVAILFASGPILVYVFLHFVKYPILPFILLFVTNYFIMGLTRYVHSLPGGIVIDVLLLLTLSIAFIRTFDRKISWQWAANPLSLLTGIWLMYCVLLLFNPLGKPMNWLAGIRGIAVYMFLFPILTVVLFNKYKYLKIFMLIWSVLTLLAVVKVMMQKYVGFDDGEKYWLYVLDGARTHIIYSGTRYFSFFTDAAAFGCGMAFSFIVFSIYAIYCPQRTLKIYFWLVALSAGMGMMASGTRAAIFIVFAGYMFYILLSKQWKIIIPGIIIVLSAFVFFQYTTIGQGNSEIRRMRTAFHRENDASYNVRFENQEKMKVFMQNHPFGVGIGSAKRSSGDDYMTDMPTDSSLVMIWVETGIIGLILFLSIFALVLIKGAYDVFFKIKDRELKGALSALLGGVAGMLVAGYGSEILQQFPNGPIVYISMAFILMGKRLDKKIADEKSA